MTSTPGVAEALNMDDADGPPGQTQGAAPRPKAGFGRAAQAVFWSFFGVRKQRDYSEDLASLSVLQVIIAAIIGALIFIALLIGVVFWVTP